MGVGSHGTPLALSLPVAPHRTSLVLLPSCCTSLIVFLSLYTSLLILSPHLAPMVDGAVLPLPNSTFGHTLLHAASAISFTSDDGCALPGLRFHWWPPSPPFPTPRLCFLLAVPYNRPHRQRQVVVDTAQHWSRCADCVNISVSVQ